MPSSLSLRDMPAVPDTLYRYTLHLLKHYRSYSWQLAVSAYRVSQLTNHPKSDYTEPILDYSVYPENALRETDCYCDDTSAVIVADHVDDSQNSQLKQLQTQISFLSECLSSIKRLTDLIRNHHPCGEQYYLILFYTYLSSQKPECTEDILELLAAHGQLIPRRSYFRKRKGAVETLAVLMAQKNELWNPEDSYTVR